MQCRVTANRLRLLVTDANKDSVIRKIKETKMLEGKITKEDLIRDNVDKDRVIQAIRRYVCSIPEYLDRQVKVFSTNGLGKWEMVVSQRDVEEFIASLLPMEFLGLIAPEDIVDVREEMKLEGSHPVWGWKRSGFAMDCRSEISLYYMEIPFEFFMFY